MLTLFNTILLIVLIIIVSRRKVEVKIYYDGNKFYKRSSERMGKLHEGNKET